VAREAIEADVETAQRVPRRRVGTHRRPLFLGPSDPRRSALRRCSVGQKEFKVSWTLRELSVA
jgi:hypothetical protein